MGTVISILITVAFILFVILGPTPPIRDKSYAAEGAKRTGRIGLWIAFWPAGLWRSWKHGQNKRG